MRVGLLVALVVGLGLGGCGSPASGPPPGCDAASLKACDVAGMWNGTVDFTTTGGSTEALTFDLTRTGSMLAGSVDDRSIDANSRIEGTHLRLWLEGGYTLYDGRLISYCSQIIGGKALEGAGPYRFLVTRKGAPDGGLHCGDGG